MVTLEQCPLKNHKDAVQNCLNTRRSAFRLGESLHFPEAARPTNTNSCIPCAANLKCQTGKNKIRTASNTEQHLASAQPFPFFQKIKGKYSWNCKKSPGLPPGASRCFMTKQTYPFSGDHAGSDACPGVCRARSLNPVISTMPIEEAKPAPPAPARLWRQ